MLQMKSGPGLHLYLMTGLLFTANRCNLCGWKIRLWYYFCRNVTCYPPHTATVVFPYTSHACIITGNTVTVVRLLFNPLRPGNASTESHPSCVCAPGSLQPAVPSQSFHLLLKIANSHLSHDTGEPIAAAWRRDTRLRRDVDLSVRVCCWQSGSDSVACTAEWILKI